MASTPRRSPRLAEKVAATAVPDAAAVPPPPAAEVPQKKEKVPRPTRQQLLADARELRYQLVAIARTPEDFAACRARAHRLADMASRLHDEGQADIFITDCAWWCRQAKRGNPQHAYAVGAINSYFKALGATPY
jgi:hypothetical protein